MQSVRYETIGRDTHRHGRLSCLLDVDVRQKKLFVHVIEARGVATGLDNAADGGHVYVRTQLLPSKNPMVVNEDLFAATDAPEDNYHHTSEKHVLAPNPYFGEEYVIDLSEVWAMLPDFRLHFAVWSDVQACSDGSGFLGCTSFGIDEIIRIATNVDVSGERPRWWWLFTKDAGVFRNKAVEQMAVAGDPARQNPDMVVSGRSPTDPNSAVNGHYAWQPDTWNGRATYKQKRPVGAPFYLFYASGRGVWAVGAHVGTPTPVAYCESSALTPDRCVPRGGAGSWQVYSLDAVSAPPTTAEESAASFARDPTMRCAKATGPDLTPTAPGYATPSSARAVEVLRIVASVDEFAQQLGVLTVALEKTVALPPADGGLGVARAGQLFANVDEVAQCNAVLMADLLQARQSDPHFDRPIGPLLHQSFSAMIEPFLRYCRDLPARVVEFRRLMTEEDGALYRATLESPARGVRLDSVAVATAMEAPFLQLQRYPHYVHALWRASETDSRPLVQHDLPALAEAGRVATQACADVQELLQRLAAERKVAEQQRRLAAAQVFDGNVFEATLFRGEGGFGFSIDKLVFGLFISKVTKAARMSHPLLAGTKIVSLNGTEVLTASKHQITALFAESSVLNAVVEYVPRQFAVGRALKKLEGFHNVQSRTEAVLRIRAARKGEGSYLLWVPDDEPNTLVLSVIESGMPRHHVVELDTDERYRVDGHDFSQSDELPVALSTLRRARPGWSTPLTFAVPYDAKSPVSYVTVPHGSGGFGLKMGGAHTEADIQARGGGIYLSGVVPGTSGEQMASRFIGWQIVSVNDVDTSDGCTDVHLRGALAGAGSSLTVGFIDNPELLVRHSRATRMLLTHVHGHRDRGLKAADFSKALAAEFVRAFPVEATMALDSAALVGSVVDRIDAVHVAALLEANGTLGHHVQANGDIRAGVAATIESAAGGGTGVGGNGGRNDNGSDDDGGGSDGGGNDGKITLAGFVTAFGGDPSTLDFPKTLVPPDSDDDDDDAWEAAKPEPVNAVQDRFTTMQRGKLVAHLRSRGLSVSASDSVDALRRRAREADAVRVAALTRGLVELFLAAVGQGYDVATAEMATDAQGLVDSLYNNGLCEVLLSAGVFDEFPHSGGEVALLRVSALGEPAGQGEPVTLAAFVEAFGGSRDALDGMLSEGEPERTRIAFYREEKERSDEAKAAASASADAAQAEAAEEAGAGYGDAGHSGGEASGGEDNSYHNADYGRGAGASGAASDEQDGGADPYEGLGKLGLIKILRSRDVDYSDCRNAEELRRRARETDPNRGSEGAAGGVAASVGVDNDNDGDGDGNNGNDDDEVVPEGCVRVELTKSSEEKWGLAIAKRPSGGGLQVKENPKRGSAASRAVGGVIRQGWLIERVNGIDSSEWAKADIKPHLAGTNAVTMVLAPPVPPPANDDDDGGGAAAGTGADAYSSTPAGVVAAVAEEPVHAALPGHEDPVDAYGSTPAGATTTATIALDDKQVSASASEVSYVLPTQPASAGSGAGGGGGVADSEPQYSNAAPLSDDIVDTQPSADAYEVPVPVGTDPAVKISGASSQPQSGPDEYDNMKRLALIKLLRTRSVDYGDCKELEELRVRARETDPDRVAAAAAAAAAGGGGGDNGATSPTETNDDNGGDDGSVGKKGSGRKKSSARRSSRRASRKEQKAMAKAMKEKEAALSKLTPIQRGLAEVEVPWYVGDVTRDDSERALAGKPTGAFVVRHSSKGNTGLCLTAVPPGGGVGHWSLQTPDGSRVGVGGSSAVSASVQELVRHLAGSDEELSFRLEATP